MNPDDFESTTSYAYDPQAEIPWPDRKEICWIVAGTQREFDEYVKKKKEQAAILRQELMVEYRYVFNRGTLLGHRITKGFYIGSYKDRVDIQEITDTINSYKVKAQNDDEADDEALKQALKKINGGQVGGPSI